MNNFRVKFRPSSHSTNYTIICTFPSVKTAKKAAHAYRGRRRKNVVYLNDYVDAEESAVIRSWSNAFGQCNAKIEVCAEYQKLKIKLSLPSNVPPAILPLFDLTQTNLLLGRLRAACPPPTVQKTKNKTVYTFNYTGSRIFYDGNFFFRDGQELRPNSAVKVLEKSVTSA